MEIDLRLTLAKITVGILKIRFLIYPIFLNTMDLQQKSGLIIRISVYLIDLLQRQIFIFFKKIINEVSFIIAVYFTVGDIFSEGQIGFF